MNDRLRLLGVPQRELLEFASLLGYRLDASVLAKCAGWEIDATLEALDRAVALDLLAVDPEGYDRYRFRHALTQAALRDALDDERKRMLHAAIASGLERLPGAEHRAEQLAHHWSQAGDPVKAAAYEALATRCALRLGFENGARAG